MVQVINLIRRAIALVLRKAANAVWQDRSLYEANGNRPFNLNGWDHIPQNQYDYTPKGTHVSGLASQFLLVPKNRYRLVLLPDQQITSERGIGWITEDNSPSSYDRLWGDAHALEKFRAESGHVREKMTAEIVDHIDAHLSTAQRVVDIGCGAGDLLAEVRRRRPQAVLAGLDYSGKAVESAALAVPGSDLRQFIINRELPFDSHQFDLVMCCDVLEHLEHPSDVVAELVRICRPGGLVAIVVPDGDVDQFFGHYWFWNAQSLEAMLAPWSGVVSRLPESREFIALIHRPFAETRA